MNEIVISPFTHAIVTYSKSHYLLTEKQHKILEEASQGDKLDIDGNLVSVNNIAEIMTLPKYYETYPDRKPQPKAVNGFEKYESVIKQPIGRNGLASMIKGLKRFIDEYKEKHHKEPEKAQYELNRLVNKYERQYGNK